MTINNELSPCLAMRYGDNDWSLTTLDCLCVAIYRGPRQGCSGMSGNHGPEAGIELSDIQCHLRTHFLLHNVRISWHVFQYEDVLPRHQGGSNLLEVLPQWLVVRDGSFHGAP